jgi:hypothetical protein
MRRLSTILTTGLNKAWKSPLALLVSVAVVVTGADLALVATHRYREAAHRTQLADALRPFHVDASGASAADHPFPPEATGSPQVSGWDEILPGWPSYFLPFGAEKGTPTDLSQHLPGLPSR